MLHPFLAYFQDDHQRLVQAIFESPSVGVVIGAPDFSFVDFNQAFCDIVGYEVDEMRQMTWQDITHPDDIDEEMRDAVALVRGEREEYRREKRYIRKDGTITWIELIVRVIRNEAGGVDFFVGFVRPIDERVQSFDAIQHQLQVTQSLMRRMGSQNRQLREFAQMMSHNVRMPVGNVRDLLKIHDRSTDEAERAELLEQVRSVVEGLRESIDILSRTLTIRQGVAIPYDRLDVADVFHRVCTTLVRDIESSDAVITTDFSACAEVDYPESYFESILHNLLTNALKYRSADRRLLIDVRTHADSGSPVLIVRDNGQGIDLSLHGDRLFGLWQTFHDNTDARGVGLYMTRTMVEAQGGSITCASKPGEGAAFTVRLGNLADGG